MEDLFANEINEECGVFGIFNHPDAANLTYYGMHALQHRGQEGCGMVISDEKSLSLVKGEGLVTEVFTDIKMSQLKGTSTISHVRYSTAGGGGIVNVQPFLFRHSSGDFALAHNGNIVNSNEVKNELEEQGSIFQSTSDSEILAHLLKKDHQTNRIDSIRDALCRLEGGFAFLIMTVDRIYAARDKYGLRPLSLGSLGEGYILASETCAIEAVGGKFIRDLEPGEIIRITKEGIKSSNYATDINHAMCAMEFIYFARPDSNIEGLNCHYFRKMSGKALARYAKCDADIVIGVPDSSLSAAIGYAEESGIPYETGLLKNKYIGRTFIQPSQEMREHSVKLKLSVVKSVVNGKRVVLIDDSIVRGTTSKRIVTMLKNAGATEVHVRIASPQLKYPCFYGVDISTYEELISAKFKKDKIKEIIGADSLEFLPVESLLEVSGRSELCMACFSGKYPTHLYQSLKDANKDGKF